MNFNLDEKALRRFDASMGPGKSCPLEWLGHYGNHGYGDFVYQGKRTTAHRFAFVLAGGVLAPGQVVRHTCDNPRCVTPAHLLAGSIADNVRDAVERGRTVRGEKKHCAKLTESQVLGIFTRLRSGDHPNDIAAPLGVSSCLIYNIRAGRVWGWLTKSLREQAPMTHAPVMP